MSEVLNRVLFSVFFFITYRSVSHPVSVGYEYESCASLILWEKRTAILQGYELDPTNLGGWSLDKHHILNTRSGAYIGPWYLHIFPSSLYLASSPCVTSLQYCSSH